MGYIDYVTPDTLSAGTWHAPTMPPLSSGSEPVLHTVFIPTSAGEVNMCLVNWDVWSYNYALTRGGQSLLLTEDNAAIVPIVKGGHLVVLPYLCGDANGDPTINVSDAVYIINYVFTGGFAPEPLDSADANCDAIVNVSDAVHIINYVFVGGNAPSDC